MFKNENEYYRVEICDPFLEKLLNSKDFGRIETVKTDETQIHVRFGTYPQSKITDNVLIAKLLLMGGIKEIVTDASALREKCHKIKNGYYIDINHNSDKYRVKISYPDGKPMELSCFKFEPIDWTVYEDLYGTYSIIPDKILDCVPFNENNFDIVNISYLRSTVRKWLNNVFYADAFNSDFSKYIMHVTSNLADDKGNNTYYDKVDLLPIEGYEKVPSLGSTDYAQSMGLGIFPEMTRSTKNQFVYGANSETYPKTLAIGVRPGIRLTKIAGAMYKV